MGKRLHKESQSCQEDMGTDEFACLPEMIADSMWRAMGWVCDEKPNALIHTLKQVSRRRNTK